MCDTVDWASAELLAQSLVDAIPGALLDDLPFLAMGSKPEHIVRDLLALYLHQTTNLISVREYSDSSSPSKLGKRVDLALLSSEGPILLIELKAWAHFDALNDKKLRDKSPKQGIMGALLSDAEKLRNYATYLRNNGRPLPKLFAVGIFFAVAVDDLNHPHKDAVKYAGNHQRALNEFGTLDSLCNAAMENVSLVSSEQGETVVSNLARGMSWGMDVRLDVVVTQILINGQGD